LQSAHKDRPPGVLQRRFYDFQVWSERKRVEKLRYMHRNPVKDALVQVPEQWMWSSYRSYAYGEEGLVRINQWRKAELRFRPVA
jgi:putative transposase